MNAIQLLREQLKSAHETLDATMAGTEDEVVHFTETNKALPVGAAYVHAVAGEDMVLCSMILHRDPIYAELKPEEIGLSEHLPSMTSWDQHDAWARRVKVNIAKFEDYRIKVYAQTDSYLAALKEEDLDTEMDVPGMGKHNLAFLVSNFIILHLANLAGEISAAKGFQGKKGYPF